MWWKKAFALFVLNILLWPPTMALVVVGAWWVDPMLAVFAFLPTFILLSAIVAGGGTLPSWAWMYNTPDSPHSPYSQYEAGAVSYYKLGRFIGDYMWLAWRNSWYGLSFKWAVHPASDWTWETTGNPWAGNKVMVSTGKPHVDGTPEGPMELVFGHATATAKKDGEVVAWARTGAVKLFKTNKMLLYTFGWKCMDWVQNWSKPSEAPMIAFQVKIRTIT